MSCTQKPLLLLPIQQREGDLLEVPRGIIVQGCNAQGAMGAGVALAIRTRWPQVFDSYRAAFIAQGNKLFLGQVSLVPVAPDLFVANAIAQENYGAHQVQVSYNAVHTCFRQVAAMAHKLGLPLHFPLIGCGLAGGEWAEVAKQIEAAAPAADKTLWVQPRA